MKKWHALFATKLYHRTQTIFVRRFDINIHRTANAQSGAFGQWLIAANEGGRRYPGRKLIGQIGLTLHWHF